MLPMNGMLGCASSTHDFYGSTGHPSDPINTSPVMGQIKNLDLQSLQPVSSSNSNLNNISLNSSSSDNSCNSGTNNTGSVGSVTSVGSKKRTVNFKLDIKPEPSSNNLGGAPSELDSIQYGSQGILQKVPSISDLSEPESSLDIPIVQVTPLTPSTKGFVLKTSYASWDKDSERLGVSKDPRSWTKEHVSHWLSWAIREFSLAEPNYSQFVQQFQITGKEACALSKDEFLARAPNFMGDILWAHLEMLQKEVDREKNLIQNIQSGYSDAFTNENNFMGNRTYTQLDSTTPSPAVLSTNGQQPAPPPLIPSTSAAIALAAQQVNTSLKNNYSVPNSMPLQYNNQQHRNSCSTTSVTSSLIHNPITSSTTPSESWNHTGSNAGSVADGSEYSYHA